MTKFRIDGWQIASLGLSGSSYHYRRGFFCPMSRDNDSLYFSVDIKDVKKNDVKRGHDVAYISCEGYHDP
jgi:hypothetical protein